MVDAAHGPGDRLEALGPDRRAAHVADARRSPRRASRAPARRRRASRRGSSRRPPARCVRRPASSPRPRACRTTRRAIGSRGTAVSVASSSRSSSRARFEHAPGSRSVSIARQTPSRSGSPPTASTWPLPSDAAKHRRGEASAAARLELLEDLGGVVDAQHDQVAGPRAVERPAGRLHLVEHDLGVARARARRGSPRRTPSRISSAVSPRSRPRGLRSSRMMTSSK